MALYNHPKRNQREEEKTKTTKKINEIKSILLHLNL